jgi:hypothetical protein
VFVHLDYIQLLFWAAGLFTHSLLLVVLWIRHRASSFPFFTTLVAMNVINSIVLYEVAHYGSRNSYLVAYFGFAILDLILQLCVFYELAAHVFCPTGVWAPDVRRGFAILVIVSIVIAVGIACLPTPPEKRLMKSLLDRGNLFSSALLCELFVAMIAFSATARLPWKTHVARISQALGFYSLIGIVTEAGHNVIGMSRGSALSKDLTFIRMATYLVCVTYWIVMLWRDAPAPKELPEQMRSQLFALQRSVEYDLRKLRALKR